VETYKVGAYERCTVCRKMTSIGWQSVHEGNCYVVQRPCAECRAKNDKRPVLVD
jgi:hypothetical protein